MIQFNTTTAGSTLTIDTDAESGQFYVHRFQHEPHDPNRPYNTIARFGVDLVPGAAQGISMCVESCYWNPGLDDNTREFHWETSIDDKTHRPLTAIVKFTPDVSGPNEGQRYVWVRCNGQFDIGSPSGDQASQKTLFRFSSQFSPARAILYSGSVIHAYNPTGGVRSVLIGDGGTTGVSEYLRDEINPNQTSERQARFCNFGEEASFGGAIKTDDAFVGRMIPHVYEQDTVPTIAQYERALWFNTLTATLYEIFNHPTLGILTKEW
jgi:hypothetical protein